MNIFTKKSAFGAIAVAGAGLIIAGAAAPAMASTASEQGGSLTTSSDRFVQADLLENLSVGDLTGNFGLTGGELSNSSPLVFSPEASTDSDDVVTDVVDGTVDTNAIIDDVLGDVLDDADLTSILGD